MTSASDTQLDAGRYLRLLDSDTDRMLDLAGRGLDRPVPSCPGWDVAEVVWHTAVVFEHKVRVLADNAWPDPWPPPDFDEREELPFLRSARERLVAEFARHRLDEPATTFGPDRTVGFWVRRMALEAAVHRYDVELALGELTPVPDDLALDGVDEVLQLMLGAGDAHRRDPTGSPVDAAVAFESGGHRWHCDVRADAVAVTAGSDRPADATVMAPPAPLFLWLWGREPEAPLQVAGDAALVPQFRARLAECLG